MYNRIHRITLNMNFQTKSKTINTEQNRKAKNTTLISLQTFEHDPN